MVTYLEFMDFEYLRKAASNLATLANLAWATKHLPMWEWKTWLFLNIGLKAAENKKTYGYQVLIRETSSTNWEKNDFRNRYQSNNTVF
jgi:hypothetical protein